MENWIGGAKTLVISQVTENMDQAAESAAFKDTHRDVFAKKLTFTYNGLKFVLFNGDKVMSKVHLQDKANPVYYSSNL